MAGGKRRVLVLTVNSVRADNVHVFATSVPLSDS